MIGYVKDYDGETLTIVAPYSDTFDFVRKQVTQCEIRIDDGRSISADQRKKIYATFRDIASYSGHTPDEIKALLKYEYIARTGCDYFSLSNTDMTTAREFLQFVVEFCIEQDIPCSDNLIYRAPDTARYVYCCLRNKKCCITGKKAELHHVDAVGMGRNRKDIVHLGYRVMPLISEIHKEAHDIGQKEFDAKYHVFGIKLDESLCKIWRVKYK